MKKEELSETPTVEPTKKDKSEKKKKKKNKCLDPSPLILSIAAYLQHQGFANTLAAFQSEASIGQLDDSKVHELDLEMFYKYLETSTCDSKSDKNVPEELGMPCLQNAGVVEGDQEKSKRTACTALIDKTAPESQLYDSKEKSKDKKRKKSKLIAVENDGSETCTLEGKSVAEKSSTEIQSNEENVKPKIKKKKNKSLESALKKDTKESDQAAICKIDSTKESNLASEDHTDGTDKKSSKKRKRMVSKGNESQPDVDIRTNGLRKENAALEDDTVSKDKKSSKKRKKMTTGGNEFQPDDDENKAVPLSQDAEVMGNGCMVEDRNTEGSKKLHETSIDEKVGVFSVGKNTPKGSETPIEGVFHPNGDLEKNGTGTGSRKSTKKQQNGSSEPKSANAFQRVKIDEVVFADDRLQDNSYWAKSGAEVGYGAKAQEVLGQVRGRDFRHEKTKKKRGSYRGGQIDLQTHSIKFNYSDEE